MKKVACMIWLLLILQLFPSCKHTNDSERESASIFFDKALNIDSISQIKQRKLVYVFNGNCSLCVIRLKELQDQIDSGISKIATKPIFIATKADADILAYNLEKINFKYSVVFDSLNLFQKKNTELNIENDCFFLLDCNNKILSRSKSLPKQY